MSYFIVVYPNGDQSKLSTAEISDGMEYEEADYALASSRRYDTVEEANDAARRLARANGKQLHDIPNLLD